MTNLRILIARTCLGLGSLTSVELEREEGQTLAEYGLILALIALVVIGAVIVLGGQINSMFQQIGSQI
jgi:pilus assembly protein Flp/PilA